MAKKVLCFAAVFAALLISAAVVSAQEPVKPGPYGNVAPITPHVTRSGRTRVGLGFNGIPLDGSHREATRMRRALRNGQQ